MLDLKIFKVLERNPIANPLLPVVKKNWQSATQTLRAKKGTSAQARLGGHSYPSTYANRRKDFAHKRSVNW
jgi:hypothetical protein